MPILKLHNLGCIIFSAIDFYLVTKTLSNNLSKSSLPFLFNVKFHFAIMKSYLYGFSYPTNLLIENFESNDTCQTTCARLRAAIKYKIKSCSRLPAYV